MSRNQSAGRCGSFASWVVSGVLLAAALPAAAQFQIHHWANFENGQLPANVFTIGTVPDQTVRVVELSSVPGMPSSFYGGDKSPERGRYALRLRVNPPDVPGAGTQTGIGIGFLFDRDTLGASGRALFQADFFFPDDPMAPNLALLAVDASEDEPGRVPDAMKSVSRRFYRFGITKGIVPYFSYLEPGASKATKFQQDRALMASIPKPGWHRFTLVLDSNTLECYVDGRGTIFSPYKEKTLRKLYVGVLVADPERSYDCYVDNLSIQIAGDRARLPDSPYGEGWTIPAGLAALRDGRAPSSNAERDTRWMEAAAAWKKAQETNRPLFLFFCSPGLDNSDRVEAMFSKVPDAQRVFTTHVASRIDVNQLQGGEAARQYGIYKVPTLMVIAPDARSWRKATPSQWDDWPWIAKELGL